MIVMNDNVNDVNDEDDGMHDDNNDDDDEDDVMNDDGNDDDHNMQALPSPSTCSLANLLHRDLETPTVPTGKTLVRPC